MKTFLFRFSTGLTCFLFGLGCFASWLFLVKPNEPIKMEVAEWDVKPEISDQKLNSETVETYDEESGFDKEGYYYIIGELPKEFADFNEFYIQIWEYDQKTYEPYLIKPKGFLIKDEKEVNLKKVLLGPQNLSFETQTKNGISYQFKGNFVKKTYIFEEDRVYLEGTLKKFQNGKKVTEKQFKFGWFVDGC